MDLADRINVQVLQSCQVVEAPSIFRAAAPSGPGFGALADGLTVEVLPLTTPGISPEARFAARVRDVASGKSVTLQGTPHPRERRLGRVTVWVKNDDPESRSPQKAWTHTAEIPGDAGTGTGAGAAPVFTSAAATAASSSSLSSLAPPTPASPSYWSLQLVVWRPLQGVLLSGSMLDVAGGILAQWQTEAAAPEPLKPLASPIPPKA